MKYYIWATYLLDFNTGKNVSNLNYMEEEGQKQIFDNPTTEIGKKLLIEARKIMLDKSPRRLEIVLIE